jgi:excinuclease ABC subunit A
LSDVVVRGAREHNLQHVDLDLPRNALIVFCGPSGSGKSSLAFDTLHAEGQRRYLEALDSQVRRLGGKLRRPRFDVVMGLPPTVGLEQRGGVATARSTVGTLSEMSPVLRVLFARSGVQHCPSCDAVIRAHTHDEIVARLLTEPAGTRLALEAPLRRSARTLEEVGRLLEEVARAGFSRLRVGADVVPVEDVDRASAAGAEILRVVVDRVRLEPDRRDRLHDAVRTTARAGRGVLVATLDSGELVFTDRPYCLACDRALPVMEPGLATIRSLALAM